MANYAVSTASIVLQTATVTRAGFGTPIFISSHRSFQERIRSYGSATDVAEDFGTDSAAYIAATQFFSHDVSISTLKIGRREASGTYTPANVGTGSVHTITVAVNDGDAVTASYTASVSDTAEDVVTAIVAAIAGDADVAAHVTAALVGTGAAAVMTLSLVGSGDVYSVSELLNVSESYATTETAADVMTAIQNENDDFYFVTADDHTGTFVLAMAGVVQSQGKLYFTSSQEAASITTVYSDTATDIAAQLKQNVYTRTAFVWDEEADTTFIECNYVGVNAPVAPDEESQVWDGRVLPGQSVAKNSTGNALNATQQANLEARNASFIATSSIGPIIVGGKTSSGEWIDNIRTVDCMVARITEAQDTLILNQQGKKLPSGDEGKVKVESRLINALLPFIASSAIRSFTTDLTESVFDANTRRLSNVKFDAIFEDAIIRVTIAGTLRSES